MLGLDPRTHAVAVRLPNRDRATLFFTRMVWVRRIGMGHRVKPDDDQVQWKAPRFDHGKAGQARSMAFAATSRAR